MTILDESGQNGLQWRTERVVLVIVIFLSPFRVREINIT